MVVYADMIFMLNFLMDAAIIRTTAWAAKTNVPIWRIALSAIIGAAYVLMIFVPSLSFMFTFIVKFLFSLAMTAIAFGFGSLQRYVRILGLFYAVNFIAAGGIFAVHYFMQSSHEVMNGIVLAQTGGYASPATLAAWFVIMVFFASLLLYRLTERGRKRRTDFAEVTADVCVRIEQYETKCLGLIDTGNRLYDPLTRMPVMVMDIAPWRGIMPEEWMQLLQTEDTDEQLKRVTTATGSLRERLRLVPYKGIQKDRQFMLAVKPDKVVIRHRDKTMEATKLLIGFSGRRLSSDGSYQVIIHPELV